MELLSIELFPKSVSDLDEKSCQREEISAWKRSFHFQKSAHPLMKDLCRRVIVFGTEPSGLAIAACQSVVDVCMKERRYLLCVKEDLR